MDSDQWVAELRSARPVLAETLVLAPRLRSTNGLARSVLKALPASEARHEALFVALEQTSGRGRGAHTWASPKGGGLFASLLWPLGSEESVRVLPLAAAIGLCRAMRSVGVSRCELKWPNDLVVEGRKLGGILIEVVGSPPGAIHAVIGFGINYEMGHETLERLAAAAVKVEVAEPPDLAELTIDCVGALRDELSGLDDPARVAKRYRELLAHRRGDRLIWRQGREMIEGRFCGIDEMGYLELETENGLRVVSAGEVVDR